MKMLVAIDLMSLIETVNVNFTYEAYTVHHHKYMISFLAFGSKFIIN